MTLASRWFPDSMPLPWASVHTIAWWQAAAEHRLVVQTCSSCGATRHPPSPRCWACHAAQHDWVDVPGTGIVYTFTVVHQAFVPALAGNLPHVVVAVELDESGGARLVSNLVDVDPNTVTIGLPVAVVWEDMGPELSLPRFVPAGPT